MIAQLAITQLNIAQPLAQPLTQPEQIRSSNLHDRSLNGTKPSLKTADLTLGQPPKRTEPHPPEFDGPEFDRHEPERMEIEGLVQVITARHRSFFTQVLAQALRSAGQGTSVLVVQFLKGGIQQGPEHPVHLGQRLHWYRCNLEICVDPYRLETLTPEVRQKVQDLWQHTQSLVLDNCYELVILDEISLALKLGLIQEAEVMRLVQERPARVEIVLTGPDMPKSLLSLADQVTELRRSPRV
jgi:cob(I)alamin adenosyltransferase